MDRRDATLVGSLLLCIITQLCGGPCHNCPWPTPRCPPGVPTVLDGCRCCPVCARQEGEGCTERFVCDSQLGLQCDYSASYPGGPGECVSKNLLGCELNGMRFDEGQTFQPSCAQLCHCLGGGVTCVPLCSDDLQVPAAANCPNPQLLRQPGRCCREWVCESLDNNIYADTMATVERPPERERVRQDFRGDGGGAQSQGQGLNSNCIEQSTDWSPCSSSCGPGVSTRSSNQNWACRPQTQTRLCQVRPCQATAVPRSRSQAGMGGCDSSFRSPVPIHLEHQGCLSTLDLQASCPDGRCCSPYRTRTVSMAFRCPQGRMSHQQVMMIESCSCHHYNCPQSPLTAYRRAMPWL
ncbi:unnamed protein product [Coregonus sp. 'balchen']|nr:unnamed protein product [Coregonus sp. 'balchen']